MCFLREEGLFVQGPEHAHPRERTATNLRLHLGVKTLIFGLFRLIRGNMENNFYFFRRKMENNFYFFVEKWKIILFFRRNL